MKEKKLNIVYSGNEKTFDVHWCDLNALFVFDKSKDRFVWNKLYTEGLYIVHDEYLRHGKKLEVNNFYIDYFTRKAKGSQNDALLVTKDD